MRLSQALFVTSPCSNTDLFLLSKLQSQNDTSNDRPFWIARYLVFKTNSTYVHICSGSEPISISVLSIIKCYSLPTENEVIHTKHDYKTVVWNENPCAHITSCSPLLRLSRYLSLERIYINTACLYLLPVNRVLFSNRDIQKGSISRLVQRYCTLHFFHSLIKKY